MRRYANLCNRSSAMTFLTPDQVAERYQISPDSLKEWRYKGVGPKYLRIGKRVRYREADLERWEQEREAANRALPA
jgi:predicted site-specific integrase-resolvase